MRLVHGRTEWPRAHGMRLVCGTWRSSLPWFWPPPMPLSIPTDSLPEPRLDVFAWDASCVRDLAGDARGTVATCDIRDGEEAKEGKEKEKKPGPPPPDRPTRENEREGLSPRQIVIAAMR